MDRLEELFEEFIKDLKKHALLKGQLYSRKDARRDF